MLSTMQDRQLTVQGILRHGASVYGDSEVATFDGERICRASYAQVANRIERLAAGLLRLGIRPGDRVGSFCWNSGEHLEAYLAVPSMGAVLHTLNVRLFPEQLAYIVNHAEDRVIIVDAALAPVLAKAAGRFRTVERYIVVGKPPVELPGESIGYEELLGAERACFDWPELDERVGAVMCYTSGTTGNPKGVVYSHRSIYLHSMSINSANCVGLSQNDRLMVVTSMFHANSWGLPDAAWLAGCDLLFPGRFLQPETLCRLITQERPTVSSGVPSIWADLLRYADIHRPDLSSLRMVVCGGSAVPGNVIESFYNRHGVRIVQAWGMTETSPIAGVAHPPKGCTPTEEGEYRAKSGRVVAGVELRIVDEDKVLPADGESVGEFEARGVWVTGSYYGGEGPERFHDAWLRTGDVGTLDSRGFLQLKDRAKDVIKSGGEWVSSVELENAIMSHPDVVEAAVIGVPDPRWDERPLACVVLKAGATASAAALCTFLQNRVVKWWIPERWAFVEAIPKTSVGKFDKKVLRARQAQGEIAIVDARAATPPSETSASPG
jgi:fatty-acyl-CoA synthase